MKKSIVAMLSITALATVANAEAWEGYYGRNFETKQNGESFLVNDNENSASDKPFYWYATNLTSTTALGSCVYTNSNYMGAEYDGVRPLIAKDASTTNKCLLVDTEGERLYRTIGGRNAYDNSTFIPYDITTNSTVYFDSLVQFTVNEDDVPTIQTGDKLAVWLKGDEGSTNLVITAGFLDGYGVDEEENPRFLNPSNYVVSVPNVDIVPGQWYRLTIEAVPLISAESIENGYVGFRVRINETEVQTAQSVYNPADIVGDSFADHLMLINDGSGTITNAVAGVFPSLVMTGIGNSSTLSCVAFEGTGAIDDLTFTDTDPFAGAAPVVPTVDGTDATDAADFLARITTGSKNKLPSGWTLDGNQIKDNTGANYGNPIPSFYTPDLADGTLTLVLNTTALPTIGAANVTVGEETEAKEAIEVDATTFTATLTSTSTKLYYGLKVAASPNAAEWTAGELTQGTGAAMQISADKPKDGSDPLPAGFFKVYVTDVNE